MDAQPLIERLRHLQSCIGKDEDWPREPTGQRPGVWLCGKANELLKQRLPDGLATLSAASEFLWDCLRTKDAISRCGQTFSQINKQSYLTDLKADLQCLIDEIAAPQRIKREGIKYGRLSSREKLRDILIEYTSATGMASWAFIETAKKRLQVWARENRHPLAAHLLECQDDRVFAKKWLEELQSELANGLGTDNDVLHYYAIVVDVVAYSTLTAEKQRATAQLVTRVSREALGKVNLSHEDDCIAIPTGDGVAFCLVGTDAETAIELAEAIRAACFLGESFLPVRIGVHHGRGLRYRDINGNINIAGPGINHATRVASEADPGAILLSYAVAQDLQGTDRYRPLLGDVGERNMKHGQQERLWELSPHASCITFNQVRPINTRWESIGILLLEEGRCSIALQFWLVATDFAELGWHVNIPAPSPPIEIWRGSIKSYEHWPAAISMRLDDQPARCLTIVKRDVQGPAPVSCLQVYLSANTIAQEVRLLRMKAFLFAQ